MSTTYRIGDLAREFELTPETAKNAAGIAQCILQGEGAWAWDPSVIDRAINEAPLVYQGQSLRLDRLVRRKATAERGVEWWVLDYKTAAAPQKQPQLIEQLQRYLRATTQQLGHEGRVHAAFLSGDGRLIEVLESGLSDEAASAQPAKPRARADNTALASVSQTIPEASKAPEQGSLF